jgi:hypothetical protein
MEVAADLLLDRVLRVVWGDLFGVGRVVAWGVVL